MLFYHLIAFQMNSHAHRTKHMCVAIVVVVVVVVVDDGGACVSELLSCSAAFYSASKNLVHLPTII